jgi:phenylacetate-CoA ligase
MTLEEVVAHARSAPYYRDLYRDIPPGALRLEDLPVATFRSLMSAVHEDPRALRAAGAYGYHFTTSGTTGKPKASLFGREEFRDVHRRLAEAHARSGALRDGDTVCSISEPGSASFMAIHHVVDSFPGRCSEIPIGCDVGYPAIIRAMHDFDATVIAGMNPTILGLAEALLRRGAVNPGIRMLLGGGELFYGAQLDLVARAFPNAGYAGFLYGAHECGLVGYGAPDLAHDEVRILDDICTVEIYDLETGEVIRAPERSGSVLVTSLTRRAAPALRVETGDLGTWRDDPASPVPRLALRGRRFPFTIDVGGITICEDDVWAIVSRLSARMSLLKLQLVLGAPHRVRVTLLDAAAGATEHETIAGMFAELGLQVAVENADLSRYEGESRRKSRLILDCRFGESR